MECKLSGTCLTFTSNRSKGVKLVKDQTTDDSSDVTTCLISETRSLLEELNGDDAKLHASALNNLAVCVCSDGYKLEEGNTFRYDLT